VVVVIGSSGGGEISLSNLNPLTDTSAYDAALPYYIIVHGVMYVLAYVTPRDKSCDTNACADTDNRNRIIKSMQQCYIQ
jgi:hypothetical protein